MKKPMPISAVECKAILRKCVQNNLECNILEEKLMKNGSADNNNALADKMKPLLERAEGVIEDAIEFEARKKSAAKKKAQRKGKAGISRSDQAE